MEGTYRPFRAKLQKTKQVRHKSCGQNQQSPDIKNG
jgi:hypothetical protein